MEFCLNFGRDSCTLSVPILSSDLLSCDLFHENERVREHK